MFIKVKLERRVETPMVKLDQKDDTQMDYIEVEEDSSLSEIAQKLQSYVNVPADDMEIRTLGKVYKKQDMFKSIWNKEQKDGCVLMLYTYNYKCSNEPKFLCFLQLFETVAALKESYEVKSRPVRQISNTNETNKSSSSDVTLIDNLDSDSQEKESDSNKNVLDSDNTESSSESTSDSSDFSDSSDISTKNSNQKAKRSAQQSQNTKMPAKLAKYLDEFPCYPMESTELKSCTTPQNQPKSPKTSTFDKEPSDFNVASPKTSKCSETEKTLEISRSIKITKLSNTIDSQIPHTMIMNILPENREFIVLILSNTEGDYIKQNECKQILNIFFKQFYDSVKQELAALNFNDNESAFKLHEGKLWIICEDEITFGWILEIGKCLSDKYRMEKFKDYYQLRYFDVVIPNVCNTNNMLIVFQLLQKQNAHIDSSLWTIAQRREIAGAEDAYYEKTVCHFCVNDLLRIGIDRNSAEQLMNSNKEFNLKYCFWKLQYTLVDSK